jgi:D-alanyl-D-alanine carboxypeptidase (penicillin-binding protein 5/6)
MVCGKNNEAFMRRTICFILLLFYFPITIFAQYFYTPQLLVPYLESAPEIVSQAAVLIDAATGALLYSKNSNEEIPPASLTKLMTMHLLMNEVKEGRASYDEFIPLTEESWAQKQPPHSSLMFLEPGQKVTLREILTGLAVSSGNDAAVAAALRLAPNVDAFANLMTNEAGRIGLNVTRFKEPSGISELNMTTAEEFALFCRYYIDTHPNSMRDFHSVIEFSYPLAGNETERYKNRPRTITQYNRNALLKSFTGVDGLKTGFINESGYNIALTAKREQTRFILVMLGAPSQRGGERIRETDSINILTWAFENFKTVRLDVKIIEQTFMREIPLWKGKSKTTVLKFETSPDFTSPVYRADNLSYEVIIPKALIAPLPEGFPAGYIRVSDEYGELSRAPIVTAAECKKGNIFKHLWHSIVLLFKKP